MNSLSGVKQHKNKSIISTEDLPASWISFCRETGNGRCIGWVSQRWLWQCFYRSYQFFGITTMIKGFIFAQKVDEGFPGGHTVDGKVIVAFHSVVFVQADLLDDVLQYLINNNNKLECMQGAYTDLKFLNLFNS